MKVMIVAAALAFSQSAFAGVDIKLIGGQPADPSEYPASVYSRQGNSRCSATVVGERTLYIAAHCVSNGGTAQFTIGPNSYTSRCTHASQYRGNSTADWALCLVDRPVEGIPYEVVNFDPSIHAIGDEVILTGYGCTIAGGSGGNDGVYRVGRANITRLPSGNNNDIVTRGRSALCFGDSGGPAFAYLDGDENRRVLISINSRGNIRDTSYLSSTSTPMAVAFAKNWSETNRTPICGLTEDAPGCRHGSEPEEPGICEDVVADLEAAYQDFMSCNCLESLGGVEQATAAVRQCLSGQDVSWRQ